MFPFIKTTRTHQMVIVPQPHHARKVFASDRIGLVGFGETARPIAVPAEPFAPWLQERIKELPKKANGSGTNLTDAIRKATEMLVRTPKGILRRIWLLTDGEANREESGLRTVVQSARENWININCIGFGDKFNLSTLESIAKGTHNGKVLQVQSLRQLTDALIAGGNGDDTLSKHKHRSETSIICIDLSLSMQEAMEGRTKIQVVEEALLRLLLYKQKCFS